MHESPRSNIAGFLLRAFRCTHCVSRVAFEYGMPRLRDAIWKMHLSK
jgi:hypothetical protein